MPEPGLTVSQFADLLIKSDMTIRRMIARRELLAVQYGPRDLRIPKHEIKRYLDYGIRTDKSGGVRTEPAIAT